MFTIIISEKGGAERKETFDKHEINVGRVQGNDLMLPKGNVSKHHARLLYRDGRFIVTDLKSTNGTYVNGRKIAQATIVREGDKIYIGDFVLRLDAGAQPAAQPDVPPPAGDEESIRTLARGNQNQGAPPPQPMAPPMAPQPMGGQPMPATMAQAHMGGGGAAAGAMPAGPPAVTLKAPTHPPGGGPAPQPMPRQPAPQAAPQPTPAQPQVQPRSDPSAVSHYPLERDPDDSESNPAAAANQRPNKGGSAAPAGNNARGSTMQMQQGAAGPRGPTAQSPGQSNNRPAVPVPMVPGRAAAPKESLARAGQRLALITLVDRIAEAVDLRPLKQSPLVDDQLAQQIDRVAREQANQIRDEGDMPEGVDLESLVRDAVRELVGLGPLQALLDDEEVTEVQVVRHDHVLCTRGGQITLAEATFTSEEALARAIGRLALQSGEPARPGELVVERRLARGTMIAILPPAAVGHVLVLRKRRRVDMALEDFVRANALARPMAVFLESCIGARVNVLVVGPNAGATGVFLAALAAAGPQGERICVLHDVEEINVAHAHIVSLPLPDTRARGEETIRAATKLRTDRMVVGSLTTAISAAVVEAIAEGSEGVLVGASAPTLRQAASRIIAQLVMTRPGLAAEAARDALCESFDVAIELTVAADGRARVGRIAELAVDPKGLTVRDIFAAAGDGEGSYAASGVVPRVVTDLASRGVKVDGNLFKRGPAR